MISAKEAKRRVDESFDLSDTLDKIEKAILNAIDLHRLSITVELTASELNNKSSIIKCLEGYGYKLGTGFGRLCINWNDA